MRHHAKLLACVLLLLISLFEVRLLARHTSSALGLWYKITGVWVSLLKFHCFCKLFLNSCASYKGWEAMFQVKPEAECWGKPFSWRIPFFFRYYLAQTSDHLFLLGFYSVLSLLWWIFSCACWHSFRDRMLLWLTLPNVPWHIALAADLESTALQIPLAVVAV